MDKELEYTVSGMENKFESIEDKMEEKFSGMTKFEVFKEQTELALSTKLERLNITFKHDFSELETRGISSKGKV